MSEKHPFLWECQPKAEAFIVDVLEKACKANAAIDALERDLYHHTSTRLFDWLDHVIVDASKEEELLAIGFVSDVDCVYYHPGAQLPKVVLSEPSNSGIAVSVERIADFLHVHGLPGVIEGSPLSGYRRCLHSTANNFSLWIVERRGTTTMEPTYEDGTENYFKAKEMWETRYRAHTDEEEAMRCALKIAEEMVNCVGKDLAAWIVCECEREYWQSRNLAGQLQKNRQDRLGLGWANHDHHTFRSSRKRFSDLVRFFEILGFHCRERFYAGEEAGWGAQVMENPRCGLVLFLDVDLDPHELEIDFAHQQLPELEEYGTIGLWCALHGDSLLKAGMHHLEAQFMHDTLTEDLAKIGVGMMDPFSDFSYLKQAFTMGEVWRVDPAKVEKILKSGKITQEEADKFLSYGAVGSHLENLQRREGYKGFNQKNVSVIIKKTDPRKIL